MVPAADRVVMVMDMQAPSATAATQRAEFLWEDKQGIREVTTPQAERKSRGPD